jgi:hypothetical protein
MIVVVALASPASGRDQHGPGIRQSRNEREFGEMHAVSWRVTKEPVSQCALEVDGPERALAPVVSEIR